MQSGPSTTVEQGSELSSGAAGIQQLGAGDHSGLAVREIVPPRSAGMAKAIAPGCCPPIAPDHASMLSNLRGALRPSSTGCSVARIGEDRTALCREIFPDRADRGLSCGTATLVIDART
jgi:hypothetical protein